MGPSFKEETPLCQALRLVEFTLFNLVTGLQAESGGFPLLLACW